MSDEKIDHYAVAPWRMEELESAEKELKELKQTGAYYKDGWLKFVHRGSVTYASPCRGSPTYKQYKHAIIFGTLGRCGNNRTKAAEELGIPIRTLQRYLAKEGQKCSP